GLAIDQIAQSGLSSLSVIYYSAQLFSRQARNRLRVRRSPAGAKQLPWRSVARRLDSAAGQEPKVSSVGVLLILFSFKKGHSRK
ncbi:hypothetical protein ELI95_28920, partial [Klebsiella pneumoniae]|nr:hypothetical protein [Klebsiella pneumoniae]